MRNPARLFLSFYCILSFALFAQSTAPAAPAVKSDRSQEPVVYESYRTEFVFENDGTGSRTTTARVRVQSDAGVQMLGQLVFGYNAANEKIEITYVRVKRADGSTVTAPADAVQDLTSAIQREAPIYTDSREKHVTVPSLRPGEILEYQVRNLTTVAFAPGQFWMAYDFEQNAIILDEQLIIDVPAGRKITLKTHPEYKAEESEAKGRHIYRFHGSHLEREDDADRSQAAQRERRKKRARLAKMRETPSVQLTTFASWSEVGAWYASLERDKIIPSAALKTKADELVRGRKTDEEKIQAVYDYVARNFRYVSLSLGLSRYQPHDANDVYRNEYGDCKDKHTLLSAMLRAEGFKPNAALMNSQRKIDADVPSPIQFDHVITQVPLATGTLWMDTTSEVAPFRLLTANIRNKKALVVAQTQPAQLETTPAAPPFESFQRFDVRGEINDLGKLTAHLQYEFRGDVELWIRYSVRQMGQPNWKKFAERLAAAQGAEGDVSNLTISDPNDVGKPLAITFDLAAPGFLDWSSKRTNLNLVALAPMLPLVDDEPEPDAEPILLGAPGEVRSTSSIKVPERYTVQLPLPFSVKRDYAEYAATYSNAGNTITAERRLRILQPELPVARTRDFLSFRKTVEADQEQRLALESTRSGGAELANNSDPDELEQAAQDALQAANFSVAVSLYEKLIAKEPTRKGAWNQLGRAYLGVRNLDKAVEAFRKQIAIDPYDETANNNLGFTLFQMARYDDAAEAYRKQLENVPLDRFAHEGIGLVLLEQKKFAEAAAELEKAASLVPDNPAIQVTLGRAYLNLDQADRAVAVFDKAVEMAPTAGTFNDIAYELARKNVKLDRAVQYAESAIASTSATLRNLNLEHLTLQQLNLVASLSAYWDTLGWVYFQKADYATSEKYIRAAWWLVQHGEVGDHLGQILEKQGKKDEAAKVYAMALATVRPYPETRARLKALLGIDARVEAAVTAGKADLEKFQTIAVSAPSQAASGKSGNADFFLMFSRGPKPELARFVNGSDGLKTAGAILGATDFGVTLPDDSPVKIVRRGTLHCAPDHGCSFTLVGADDVVSLE